MFTSMTHYKVLVRYSTSPLSIPINKEDLVALCYYLPTVHVCKPFAPFTAYSELRSGQHQRTASLQPIILSPSFIPSGP